MEDKLEIYQEERPWGNFRRFTQNANSTVKIITIKPGEEISLQSHKERSEFWRVISGSGMWDIDGAKHDFYTGDEKIIPKDVKHRVSAGSSGLQILEISLGHFSEEDIERVEDKYGRV